MSDGDAPGVVCRLLGIIVLRSVPPPQWVSVDGTRREYPVAEMSAPVPAPMTDLTAMAYTMDYRHDELVLSPRLAGQWPSIVVTSGGDVSRLR
jgi:hypothetical protein